MPVGCNERTKKLAPLSITLATEDIYLVELHLTVTTPSHFYNALEQEKEATSMDDLVFTFMMH